MQLPNQPLISVIIPCYNQARFTKEAINSALNQTYPHVEVILVNDGSTDDTAKMAAEYRDKVKYIYQRNAGTAAARNTGIRNSKGHLIALLDHDDIWLPYKLEYQLPYFMNNADVGMVYTGVRVFNAYTREITSDALPNQYLDVHDLLEWCPVPGSTSVFRRDILDKVGLFDESLSGADDWDMWIRIAKQHKIIGCKYILTESRTHSDNLKSDQEKQWIYCMALLDKHRMIHVNCQLCRKAIKKARAEVRDRYRGKTSIKSNEAFHGKRYYEAFLWRIRGLRRDPGALAKLPRRIVDIIRTRCRGNKK